MAIVGAHGALSAGRAIRGGADVVLVRAKSLTARGLATLVREVIADVGTAKKVIVHSRPDIAELVGALGVHLAESGLDPRSVRGDFPALLVGVSRHDRTGLERALDEGADYAILGPVFGTPGKEAHAMGIGAFASMVRGLALPVLAVGGVTAETTASLVDGGARGIAGLRPFMDPQTASSSASSFRAALDDPLCRTRRPRDRDR